MTISLDVNDRESQKFDDIAGQPVPTSVSPALAAIKALDSGDSNIFYLGEAAIGADTSESSWRIRKFDKTGGSGRFRITWAETDGVPDARFNKIWDDRESLTYS